MQQPDGAREPDLAGAPPDHLAAPAAKWRQVGPRRKTSAIDDHSRLRSERLAVLAEAEVDAASVKGFGQRAHRRARIDVALAGEEQPFMESAGEGRPQRRDAGFIQPCVTGCPRGAA